MADQVVYSHGVRFLDGAEGLLIEFQADPYTIIGPRPATAEDIEQFPNAYSAYQTGGGGSPIPGSPVLHSIEPESLPAQGEDTTCTITGENFTPTTIMVWNGTDDTAAYQSPTTMTTVVKASLVGEPCEVTLYMRDGDLQSGELTFVFTEPEVEVEKVEEETGKRTKRKKARK